MKKGEGSPGVWAAGRGGLPFEGGSDLSGTGKKRVLSKADCDLIILRYEAGLSAREVGEAFGISEGAVRVKQAPHFEKAEKGDHSFTSE